MIIKAMSKKDYRMFQKLVDYFTKDKDLPEPQTYNLLTPPDNLKAVVREFQTNYQKYHSRHKGSVVCMHEIISPHPSDAQHVTTDMLYDLGFQYIQERAPDSLGFLQVHIKVEGRTRPHVHILLSGNEMGSDKQISLKKDEYKEVKEKIKRYTLEKYPELKHAFQFNHQHKKDFLKEQSRRRHNEVQRYKREKSLSHKDKLTLAFIKTLRNADNIQDFILSLERSKAKLYVRGKNVGIVDIKEDGTEGRRYRLETLNVFDEFEKRQMEWKREQTKDLEQKRLQSREPDRHFSKNLTAREKVEQHKEKLRNELAKLREKQSLDRDRGEERSR